MSAKHAFVRTTDALVAVDLATGQEAGRVALSQTDVQKPDKLSFPGLAAAAGTVITADGSELVAARNAAAPPRPGSPEATPAPLDLGPPSSGTTTHPHVDAARSGGINLAAQASPPVKRWAITAATTAPLVADGRVLFVDENRLRAVTAATGAALWSVPAEGAHPWPAYENGRVFVAYADGLAAHNAATGALLWRHTRAAAAARPPTVDGDTVYASFAGTITALDAATGAVRWSRFGEGTGRNAPSLDATRVFTNGACAPLDRATGELLGGPDRNCGLNSLVVSPLQRGQIIQGGNPVRAFDVDRRVFVGSGRSNAIPPATLGNVAVFGLEDGLRAYTLPGWAPRWRLTEGFPYPLAAPPLIVGRTVYSLNTYGSLRAHDLDQGTRLWSQRAGDYFEEYSDDRPISLAVGEGLIVVPGPGNWSPWGRRRTNRRTRRCGD